MKTKQKLKYKCSLPKADYGMDPNALSNMNMQKTEEASAGESEGGGMGAIGGLGIGLNAASGLMSSFMPKQDMSNISKGGQIGGKVSKSVFGALSQSPEPISKGIGMVGSFLVDPIMALVNMIKGRNDDPLKDNKFEPIQSKVNYSFGTPQSSANPMAKYGLPLYGDGGSMKYDSNFRPATQVEQKYNEKTGLWEVSGAKPKPVTATKTKVSQKVEPIYVTDPNDSRLKSYQDSTKYYNNMKRYNFDGFEAFGKTMSLDEVKQEVKKYNPDFHFAEGASGRLNYGNLEKDNANWSEQTQTNKYKKGKHTVEPVGWRRQKDYGDTSGIVQGFNNPPVSKGAYDYLPVYKEPVQPVIYQKQEVSVPVPKKNFNNLKGTSDILGDNVQYNNEPKSQTTEKGKPLNDFLTQEVPTMNGKKIYKRKDKNSPWLEQLKDGGSVKAIETNDPYDKRLQAYNDSLSLYKLSQYHINNEDFVNDWKKRQEEKIRTGKDNSSITEKSFLKSVNNGSKEFLLSQKSGIKPIKKIWDEDVNISNGEIQQFLKDVYKKPTQPVILKPIPMAGNVNIQAQSWDDVKYALGGFINKNRINNSLSEGMYSPDGKFFSSPEQYQQYQSFYNPLSQLQQPIMNNYGTLKMKSNFRNNSFFALGGDPRAQSNIEAEQGEAMQHSSGQIENIEGQTHENGGTPLQVQPSHEYIYSNSLGYDKKGNITLNEKDVHKSFADKAKRIESKYKNQDSDLTVMTTKKLELGKLKQDAEQARIAKEEIEMGKQMKKYKAKYGMALKKYANSGYVPFTNFNQYGDEQVDPNSTLAMQQQLLQYNPNALPIFGADNKWGKETTAGFANNPGVYNMMAEQAKNTSQIQTPTFDGGTGYQNNFIGPNMPSSRLPRGGFGPYPQGQIGDKKSRGVAQDRVAIDPVNKERNGFFQDLTTGDKMQLASMLPAFGFNLGMGLRPYDKEPIRKNQYENDVLGLMSNRKFDIQNYLNQSNLATNAAREDIGNNSTSVGGKMANIQKLYANSLNALGDVTTKGQEMNNQYRAEEANTKNIIGESNRQEAIRASGITAQNKARKQQFLGKAFEQLGQGIAATGQSANQSLTNKLLIKSLSEISPDFDVKNMKDLQVGDDGYIVFKGVKTEFKMSDEGKIVMASGTPNTANAAKSQYAPKDFTMKAFANFTKTKTTK